MHIKTSYQKTATHCGRCGEKKYLRDDMNGYVSNYWYDANGERVVKVNGGDNESMFVNGVYSGARTGSGNFTAYVSPYLVVSKGGQYTKHIYIGSQRIVSKLGISGNYGPDPRQAAYAGSDISGASVDYAAKYAQSQQSLKNRYEVLEIPYGGTDNADYVNGEGFIFNNEHPHRHWFWHWWAQPNHHGNHNPEAWQYYYHSDHLGSSSLITNLNGETVQHVEYMPFGEVFFEERNNRWNTPYLFNAKELDEETGLYYYGARYYEPRTSLWLGVDPLAEMYPGISPFAYTLNNPVKYIDPDGRQIVLPAGTSTKNVYLVLDNLQKLTNDRLVYSTQKDGSIRIKVASLGDGNKVAGTNLIRRLNSSDKTLTIDIQNSQRNFQSSEGNRAKATNYTDAANGTGSDAIVSFAPTSNPGILTVNPKTGNSSEAERPNQIGLGHELIHAVHYMDGDYSPQTSQSSHTYKDASGNRVTQTAKTEELRTVGLAGTKNGDITENQLRKEQKQNQRGAY